MSTTVEHMLVSEAQAGRANEHAAGLMAMNTLAAILFLRDQLRDDGSTDPSHQQQAVEDSMLVRAKAIQFGQMAARKFCPAKTHEETVESLASSIACAIVANVALDLTARACGAKSVPVFGACAMAVQAMLKDIKVH